MPLVQLPVSADVDSISRAQSQPIWAVFKIPLSFHYTGWLIEIRLFITTHPNILGSIIP